MNLDHELARLLARADDKSMNFGRVAYAARQLSIQQQLVRLHNELPGLTAATVKAEFDSDSDGGGATRIGGFVLHRGADRFELPARDRAFAAAPRPHSAVEPGVLRFLQALDCNTVGEAVTSSDIERLERVYDALYELAMSCPLVMVDVTCALERNALFVIQSDSEGASGKPAFWNSDEGWHGLGEASLFTYLDRLGLHMPMASGKDAKWIAWRDLPAVHS